MKPIKLHITHKDVFKPNGLPRPFHSNKYCPLATAVRRELKASRVSVCPSRVSIYDNPQAIRYITAREYGEAQYNETLSRLQDNPHSYYPITLIPQ